MEDKQGWSITPILFITDCPYDIEQIEKLSWMIIGSGRISTSFEKFSIILKKHGYKCIRIKTIGEYKGYEGIPYDIYNDIVKTGFVRGATGNY